MELQQVDNDDNNDDGDEDDLDGDDDLATRWLADQTIQLQQGRLCPLSYKYKYKYKYN